MIIIFHRETREPLLRVDAETLVGADLQRARLSDADLSGTNLSGANLAHASLSQADLRHADLSDAMLWQTNLLNADLSGADLRGTMLLGAVLWGTRLTNVRWDPLTQWPYDFCLPPLFDPDGECGSKGGQVQAPGADAERCPKGLHWMGSLWGACPGCLQTLWSTSHQARKRAATACARSAALQRNVAESRRKFLAARAGYDRNVAEEGGTA